MEDFFITCQRQKLGLAVARTLPPRNVHRVEWKFSPKPGVEVIFSSFSRTHERAPYLPQRDYSISFYSSKDKLF